MLQESQRAEIDVLSDETSLNEDFRCLFWILGWVSGTKLEGILKYADSGET